MIMDGRAVANEILKDLDERITNYPLLAEPTLTIVSIGNDPASKIYVNQKVKAAERCGIVCNVEEFPEDISPVALSCEIAGLRQLCDGMIIQLPVPAHLESTVRICFNMLEPRMDVDGMGRMNRSLWGSPDGQKPCTPAGIMKLLEAYKVDLKGKNVCIINRSELVGLPLAEMMLAKGVDATVTVCHSKTENLAMHTRLSDIVVTAVGQPEFLTADMIKSGAVVIDVGISKVGNKTVGDCSADVAEKAGMYTPVPGGVGPMTVAMLMENVWKSYEQRGRIYEQ